MEEDTDFGKELHAGVVDQVNAMNLQVAGTAVFAPTAIDFNAQVTRLKEAGCDLVVVLALQPTDRLYQSAKTTLSVQEA